MKKLSKSENFKKSEKDLMIEHLEEEIKTDMHKIKWFGKEVSEARKKIAQNRKILEKLTKIK